MCLHRLVCPHSNLKLGEHILRDSALFRPKNNNKNIFFVFPKISVVGVSKTKESLGERDGGCYSSTDNTPTTKEDRTANIASVP